MLVVRRRFLRFTVFVQKKEKDRRWENVSKSRGARLSRDGRHAHRRTASRRVNEHRSQKAGVCFASTKLAGRRGGGKKKKNPHRHPAVNATPPYTPKGRVAVPDSGNVQKKKKKKPPGGGGGGQVSVKRHCSTRPRERSALCAFSATASFVHASSHSRTSGEDKRGATFLSHENTPTEKYDETTKHESGGGDTENTWFVSRRGAHSSAPEERGEDHFFSSWRCNSPARRAPATRVVAAAATQPVIVVEVIAAIFERRSRCAKVYAARETARTLLVDKS